MRVLVLSHSAVVETYRDKFRWLARLGAEVHLVLPAGWPEGGRWQSAPAPGREAGVTVHVLPVIFPGHVGGFALRGFARLAARIAPDLVHAEEEPYAIAAWQAWRAARRCGAPFVFFTWENLLRRYKPPLYWIDRAVLAGAAGAIAGNQEAEQVLRARGWRGPCRVVPQYGVDPEVFRPDPVTTHVPGGSLRIAYFGRLCEEKGLFTLLDAVRRLEIPFHLTLTGYGKLLPALRSKAQALGLTDAVEFRTSVPNAEMPAALRAADVLVLPSRTRPDWKEQFGRVLVEAMACGVPVIGSGSGEIPNVLADAGLVFPEDDAGALARHLTALHRDPALAADLSRRGRERVLAHYTTERIARQVLEVYRDLRAAS